MGVIKSNVLKIISLFSLIAVIAGIFLLSYYAQYGLDMTDEAFYLAHIASYQDYAFWPSSFGAVFHPLFMLVGQDLILLRYLVLGLVFVLAWLLVSLLLKRFTLFSSETSIGKSPLILTYAGFAATIYMYVIMTPSYNLLVFLALILVAISLMIMLGNSLKTELLGALLLGFSGVLVFLAKPSSAALLTLVILLYLPFMHKKRSLLIFFVGGLSASLFLTLFAYMKSGGVLEFAQGIQGGLEYLKIMGGGHSANDFIQPAFYYRKLIEPIVLLTTSFDPILLTALLLFAVVVLFGLKKIWWLGVLLLPILIWQMLKIKTGSIYPNQFLLVIYLCSLCLLLLALGKLLYQKMLGLKDFQYQHNKQMFAVLLLLFLFPLCATFGTGNAYITHAQKATFFYGLSSLLAITLLFYSSKLPLHFMGLFVSACLLVVIWQSIHNPYRQPDFTSGVYEPVEVLEGKMPIYLDKVTANYTRELKVIAKTMPTPAPLLFDLTGQTPYAARILNASTFGLAWTLGGYKGSGQALNFIYDQVPCKKIAGAWILLEEKGGNHGISPKILEKYGIYLKDYKPVATLFVSGFSRGRPNTEKFKQQLYKPIITYSKSLAQCVSKR